MACVDKIPHALVVPASGQGHVNACMLLARALAALGFHVSFVYFSSEYANLKAKKRLVKPDGGDPCSHQYISNTPPGSRSGSSSGYSSEGDGPSIHHTSAARTNSTTTMSTTSPPCNGGNDRGIIHIHVVEDGFAPGDMDKLFFATPAMKENLYNLILKLGEQGTSPTCLISDPFAPWTVDVAERASIPLVTYWTCTALSYVLIYDISVLYSKGIFPEKGSPTQWKRESPLMLDHIPGLPPFSSELYPKDVRFGHASSYMVSLLDQVFSCAKHAERMLIHTMVELEPHAFQAFKAVGIRADAIGPLLHHATKQEGGHASATSEQLGCISWLDKQADASVIYVAFGSIASISEEEIQELAVGLEASGNSFLWVVREDSHGGGELGQVLPDGFLDRVSGKGMIISWAPQVEVLAHKAIGGFLTHCGWNSTLESLWQGVPMLCCPCFAEQMLNSHYICDVWEVGLELGRTLTGRLERRYVELGVKALMQEQEGFNVRGKAQEVMHLARKTCQPGGQLFSNLQKFYEDMTLLCYKPSSV